MTRRPHSRAVLGALLLAALSGCAGCDTVPDDAVTDCSARVVPGTVSTDILFVVDDSGSMNGEQAELASNLGAFIDQLLGSAVRLDLQVGVTNTSVSWFSTASGTDGRTTYAAGPMSGDPYPQGSLVAVLDPAGVVTGGLFAFDPAVYGTLRGGWGGERVLSTAQLATADLTRMFKANVRQGIRGSGKEQPLRALRLALDKATRADGENFGFLRAGARLAIVVITDEDDCSESQAPFIVGDDVSGNAACHSATVKANDLDPLSEYVAMVDGIAGEPPIVAVVAGFAPTTLDPTGCTSGTTQSFDDPTRLDAWLTMLSSTHPGRTYKDSICNDFGPSLLQIASRIIPQTMPLQQAPADWRMLAVVVRRASGDSVGCRLAAANTAAAASADAIYTPPGAGAPGSITFQNGCRLGLGDRVDLNIICAR